MTTAERRVLLVDDEPDILDLLGFLFQSDPRCGEVRRTTNLDDGVVQAQEQGPDIIVLDLMFGRRMRTEVLPSLRAICPAARIIVFTASERSARAENVLAHGADLVRQKVTVSFEELIDEALSEPPA